MTHVLFLSPARTDADVGQHMAAVAAIDGVLIDRRDVAAGATLVETLRLGADLFRRRSAFDVAITVGPAALSAATVGWRGPLIHLPVGQLGPSELAVARRFALRLPFQLVTSSNVIANAASEILDDARLIHLLRPEAAPATRTRVAARAQLGVPPSAPLFHLIGVNRPGSGHRLGLWATSILAFRDQAARSTVALGGTRDDFIARFAMSTNQTRALITDSRLSAADFAIAADVAICPADGAPDFAALAACRAAGTPIVGLRSTWQRESLEEIPATFADSVSARLLARAALEAYERPLTRFAGVEMAEISTGRDAWSAVLASSVGT